MHGGFRRLVHPGTPSSEIDIEGTRAQRARINAEIRAHQLQAELWEDEYPELRVPEADES